MNGRKKVQSSRFDVSLAFANLLDETDQQIIDTTRPDLLEYCKLDTLMMMEYIKVSNK